MSAIALTLTVPEVQPEQAYQQLNIAIAGGIAEPQDLVGLRLPEGVNWSQGVILNGRAPIWVYAYLVHECHAAAWVACYDPRLGGAVVVESHRKGVNVAQVIALTPE
ncbi:CRISPR-associated ring nuclease Crn3/Csx3 [Spirulina major]|uniref:CRISPR-associated ring nuclease Crn3/Csx3 n=1 Tax=Spirulina major TaxID=270636 RepID=UPI0009335EDE|nr:CRISPR-associated ring nuclease Crn3/Csx3 [Spirulina major]